MMAQKFSSGLDKTFTSNTPLKLGFGISLNNTIFDFGYGFNFRREKEKGKTKSFDFQMHNYGRRFVFDLFIQRYQGFYNDESKNIEIYPDLKVQNYGVSVLYILNNNKYSYKAVFNHNEKQLKSAGSILLGIGAYLIKVKSDSSFIHKGKNNLSDFQLSISAGYAYTWVLGKYWDVSASSTLGIGISFPRTDSGQKQKIEVAPTIFPRIAAGYNRNDWSMGFSLIGNVIFPTMSKKEKAGLLSGYTMLTYTRRFKTIPFFDRKR
jgi:hypothetical protein